MKKILLLSLFLFLVAAITAAQTKPTVKIDTAKKKSADNIQAKDPEKTDTSKAKTEKFVKNDSAYRKLEAKKREYFKTDSAELKITSCGFEKDANAMVLSDEGVLGINGQFILFERTKRIKIFNDNGKSEANIRIEYDNKYGTEHILAVVAQTINYVNGKIEYTPLDDKLVYNQHTDKNRDAIIFSMPNVKAGSIIEYAYMWSRNFSQNFPEWNFQNSLPTWKSTFNVILNPQLVFSALFKINKPFSKDTVLLNGIGHTWAMDSLQSTRNEPFMRSAADGVQSLVLSLKSVKYDGKTRNLSESWSAVGKEIADDKDFNKQFDQKLNDENDLLAKVKDLKTDDEKIAFLFNQVKTQMKWNDDKNFATKDGIKSAWKKKSGNWGEINIILCHLLRQAGIKTYPMLVSTRDNGKIYSNFVNIYQINKLVAYVPVDTTKYYVLDASHKYNIYNEIPFDLLNSNALYINKEKEKYEMIFLKKTQPVNQVTFVNAEIKSDGTMKGSCQISSVSYNKSASLELYKTLDEKKYKEYLTDNDNNLKITSLKLENAEVDSLPLLQNIEFNLDLPGTDEKYIYFNPNLFTSLHSNPFISQNRESDIDFGYLNYYSINGRYKIPQGYKIDALPKSMNILMPDKSISFRRIVGEDDGNIVIHYLINYKKSTFTKDEYSGIYAYFKKLNEILNEQIVLKKQ